MAGEIVKSFATPNTIPQTLAIYHNSILLLDTGQQIIYQLDFNGTVLKEIPVNMSGSVGTAFNGIHIWVGSDYLGQFWQIDMEGTQIKRITTPPFIPRFTVWDKHLFIDYREGGNLIRIYNASFRLIKTITTPTSFGRGIAHDGKTIYWVELPSKTIYQLDFDGNIIRSFVVALDNMRGIAIDGMYLWIANDSAGVEAIYQVRL